MIAFLGYVVALLGGAVALFLLGFWGFILAGRQGAEGFVGAITLAMLLGGAWVVGFSWWMAG